MPENVPFEAIVEAYERISPFVHVTPVMTSRSINAMAAANNVEIFFKCENLQKTGAFKARGACNAVLKTKELLPFLKGIATHSSGNHGQAIAYACSKDVANIPCSVVVPENTPEVKCNAIKGYGAELIFCESSPQARTETCAKVASDNGLNIIHPFDDYNVIAGQATIAYELLMVQNYMELDAILVPVSGGGMISGIALAAKHLKPEIKVIAVEPLGKELGPCLKSKSRLWQNPPQFIDTIAEGIKTQQCGSLTFPILCALVEETVITITDEEMVKAMKLIAERMKLIVEGAAGAAAAAAIFHTQEIAQNWPDVKKIGAILCGGNTSLENFPH